jgi:hypothetical protein
MRIGRLLPVQGRHGVFNEGRHFVLGLTHQPQLEAQDWDTSRQGLVVGDALPHNIIAQHLLEQVVERDFPLRTVFHDHPPSLPARLCGAAGASVVGPGHRYALTGNLC